MMTSANSEGVRGSGRDDYVGGDPGVGIRQTGVGYSHQASIPIILACSMDPPR